MEWLANIWNWIVAHKDSVLVTITSSQFITFCVTLFFAMKNKKEIKSNTQSNAELNAKLYDLTKKLDALITMKQDVEELKVSMSNVEQTGIENRENNEMLLTKMNAQLDAQSQVWSTIKDEELKGTVTNILTNAKYAETGNVVELRNKIEDLQKKLDAKTTEMNKEIATTVEQVKKVVPKKSNNNIQRA